MFRKFWRRQYSRIVLTGVGIIVAVVSIGFISVATFSPNRPIDKTPFTTTVDPVKKTIKKDPNIEAMFQRRDTLTASAETAVRGVLDSIAIAINSSSWYIALADPPVRYITIFPGYRKEQVAAAFGQQLNWTAAEKKDFLTSTEADPPTILEGRFAPATYTFAPDSDALDVRAAITSRFDDEIAARYTPELEKTIPLANALTIASILEREAGSEDMRIISGIIWNRLFAGMKLQMDATLQYAKGTARNGWWPKVVPNDKYVKSLYNTYLYEGLPPAPIANPSVEAIEAALNPAQTDCLYYFHDSHRGFHCSATYEDHVALLTKYYGSGK